MIMSYIGSNKRLQDAYLAGEIELELSPQGTIAERLRAGGVGVPFVLSRTGAGTTCALSFLPLISFRNICRDRRDTQKVLQGPSIRRTPGSSSSWDHEACDGARGSQIPVRAGDHWRCCYTSSLEG